MDFDGDGRLDLLSGSNCCNPNGFHFYRRQPNGSWEPRKDFKVTFPNDDHPMFTNSFVSATDWNGDGMPDLLCVSAYHKGILVAHGPFQGNEPIALTQEIDFTPKGSVLDFAVADWDRDGKPGLLVRQRLPDYNGMEGIYWYKNIGTACQPKLAEGKLLLGEESLVVRKSSDLYP